MSKFQRNLYVSCSWTFSWFCIYHLFLWSYLIFFTQQKGIHFPTYQCLVCFFFYPFCAKFLHLVIIWLIDSSLSSHNLHLIFCGFLLISAVTYLASFCAAITRDSVSLLRLPFLAMSNLFLLDFCSLSLEMFGHFSSHFCVLDKTLNHLMVRLYCRNLCKYGAHDRFNYSKVHSVLE